MRIDSIQSNIAMRPLGNFLFKCEFSNTLGDTIVSKDVLNEKLLQKLKYSVLSLNIPRMESQQADNLNYGSFFITFPFFSTEKKEMTMRFYETDQMEIFKLFTYILSKTRWKASTMFRWEQADLYVTVTIYDQRNLYGYGYRALFSETYALKTVKVEQPEFSRTSDVTLLETTIKFNTCQNKNYDRGAITSIDAAGEFEKYDSAADNAFISAEEMGDRIAKQFEAFYQKEMEEMYKKQLPIPNQTGSNPLFSADRRIARDTWLTSLDLTAKKAEDRGSKYGHNRILCDDTTDCSELFTEALVNAGYADVVAKYGGRNPDGSYRLDTDAIKRMMENETELFERVEVKQGESVEAGTIFVRDKKEFGDKAHIFVNSEDIQSLGSTERVKTIEATTDNGGAVGNTDRKSTYLTNSGYTAFRLKSLPGENGRAMVSSAENTALFGAQSTARVTTVTTLPPDYFKELKENPVGSFNATEALLDETPTAKPKRK
jgi:hypothetical protein